MAAPPAGPVVRRVTEPADVAAVLAGAGIGIGLPVVVLVGGAGGMSDAASDELAGMVRDVLLPAVVRHRGAVVDGGTDSGVMRLVGRALAASGQAFPLVGVAAEGTVTVPGGPPAPAGAADLEVNHTHVVLVPGDEWGDESPWISGVAGVLAGGRPSVTVLVNGGRIAFDDAAHSLDAGRPLVVVAGSGRTADEIADARRTGDGEPEAVAIAASPLTRVVPLGDPAAVAAAIGEGLGEPSGGR